jgi:competence protein ComEC
MIREKNLELASFDVKWIQKLTKTLGNWIMDFQAVQKKLPVLLSILILTLFANLLLSKSSFAAIVTPSHRVTTRVNVREFPSTQDSNIVGKLKVGEEALLIDNEPRWYKVRLSNGVEGFVSKAWTTLSEVSIQEQPFAVHFVDVGVGDAIIVDMQDKEIVIDGGRWPNDLNDYIDATNIIDGPIELVIVTHADTDHWNGLVRLLGFDGQASSPKTLLEFWEPGYNRDCDPNEKFNTFISDVSDVLSHEKFHRPLELEHHPAIDTGLNEPFSIDSLPGVSFTLLSTESQPTGPDCAYKINNASIVFMLEISGVKLLFTGDANGKERDESSPGTPAYVEEKLLDLNQIFPGILGADVLKVPHHGSETASTQDFIDAVNPKYAIISADTIHDLPKTTVINRYTNGERVILRTDRDKAKNIDHILCTSASHGQIECNYRDQFEQ